MTLSFFTARHVDGVKWLNVYLFGYQFFVVSCQYVQCLTTNNEQPTTPLLKFLQLFIHRGSQGRIGADAFGFEEGLTGFPFRAGLG